MQYTYVASYTKILYVYIKMCEAENVDESSFVLYSIEKVR